MFRRARHPRFRSPHTPHFLLASRRKGFTLNVNNCLGAAVRCSFGKVISSISFVPTLVPRPKSASIHGRFRVSTDASAVFLGLIKEAGRLNGFVICATKGFHKDKGAFRLRGTCLSFLNFAVKCSAKLFVSLTTTPPAVSFRKPSKVAFCHTARLHCRTGIVGNLGININIRVPSMSNAPTRSIEVNGREVPSVPTCMRCS